MDGVGRPGSGLGGRRAGGRVGEVLGLLVGYVRGYGIDRTRQVGRTVADLFWDLQYPKRSE